MVTSSFNADGEVFVNLFKCDSNKRDSSFQM